MQDKYIMLLALSAVADWLSDCLAACATLHPPTCEKIQKARKSLVARAHRHKNTRVKRAESSRQIHDTAREETTRTPNSAASHQTQVNGALTTTCRSKKPREDSPGKEKSGDIERNSSRQSTRTPNERRTTGANLGHRPTAEENIRASSIMTYHERWAKTKNGSEHHHTAKNLIFPMMRSFTSLSESHLAFRSRASLNLGNAEKHAENCRNQKT